VDYLRFNISERIEPIAHAIISSMTQTIFITGASSGIGAALAAHYISRGANVGLLGRNGEALEQLKLRKISLKNTQTAPQVIPKIETAVADVCDAQAMQLAIEALIEKLGVPDVVIANAGVSSGTLAGAASDVPIFRRVMETNVLGLVHTFTPVVDAMVARGSGVLVGVASVAGLRGIPGSAAYSASKAAAISYCESLRVELRASGVKVLTICPGYIDTPMTQVNTFPMPFLLSADEGARRLARAIDAEKSFAIVPWQMGMVGRVMRRLPIALYDRILARMPRKPR
jgi:short-subunit dehydrogenase